VRRHQQQDGFPDHIVAAGAELNRPSCMLYHGHQVLSIKEQSSSTVSCTASFACCSSPSGRTFTACASSASCRLACQSSLTRGSLCLWCVTLCCDV
jgi:hypothetical protein